MAVKTISEFTLQPSRRDEFVRLFQSLVTQHHESMRAAGCHSSAIYVVLDEPDKALEISEWESAEARETATQSEPIMRVFAPLFELVAASGLTPRLSMRATAGAANRVSARLKRC